MILDTFRLHGRTALVTGSGRGIGRAIAEGLAEAGARVVLNGRGRDLLEATAAEMRAKGADVHLAAFDVTDGAAVAEAVERLGREVGPLDILVNNAGIQQRMPLEDFPDADWRRVLATNLDSVFYVSKAAVKHMIPRKKGAIVNIGSVMCELARPTVAPYTAAKGGVRMLTRAMATDWGRHGIRVNAIAPGYFATELNRALVDNPEFSSWVEKRTPAGRWGETRELAGAAVYLASDAASFTTGHILYVDGGMTASV
jgi:gluconate 5-dehydrogenase